MAPPVSWSKDVPANTGGSVWRSSSITCCKLNSMTEGIHHEPRHGVRQSACRVQPAFMIYWCIDTVLRFRRGVSIRCYDFTGGVSIRRYDFSWELLPDFRPALLQFLFPVSVIADFQARINARALVSYSFKASPRYSSF